MINATEEMFSWSHLGDRRKRYDVKVGRKVYHNMTLTYTKDVEDREIFTFEKANK